MSLAAAVLVGASAFAVDNVKISGNAQVFYSTSDATRTVNTGSGVLGTEGSLFDKDSSAADAGLNLNISADLAKNSVVTVSAGAGYTVLSTLGLENNFVSNVWGGSHTASNVGTNYSSYPAKVDNANWMNEAWVALSANALTKSTVKVGRMELDTPLAFTEKWSIEKNTFEAAILINQDLPDTTIVAAYIGNGNGTEAFGHAPTGSVTALHLGMGAVVNANGNFETYGSNGAYAVAAINNSWKPLTAQAWYYDVSKVAQAYWLQADLDASSLGLTGVTAGVQYASIDAKDLDPTTTASDAVAAKLGYAMKDMFSVSVAYSEISTKGVFMGNTATANTTAGYNGQTKLYTGTYWNYGQETMAGAKTWNATVTSPVAGLFDAMLMVTSIDQTKNLSTAQDTTEVTLTATKKFGPLDATLAYINSAYTNKTASNMQDYNMVQAYLTLNF